MKQTKMAARERLAQILTAALKMATRFGYARITRADVAQAAGVSEALVTYHLGTMEQLRRAVMREAVRLECLEVVAQGLVARDRHAMKAPQPLRQKALASLSA